LMIRRDLASCADIDISPLRLGNKDVLAITVAQPHPHGMNLCYRPGDGELGPHNNSAHAKAPHASGTTRPPNGEETNMPWTNEPPFTDPRYFLAAAMCNAPAPGSGSGVYTAATASTPPVRRTGIPSAPTPSTTSGSPSSKCKRGEWGWPPRRHPTDLSTPSAAWQPTPYS
jgi:hypothetical protein